MFIFEDLVLLTDVDIQSVIFEVKDMTLLATALNKASTELVNRFKENFLPEFNKKYKNYVQRYPRLPFIEFESDSFVNDSLTSNRCISVN